MNSLPGQLTSPFLPQKYAKNPPKIAQHKTGVVVGVVTVLYCDVTPRLPPGDPREEKSLSPLFCALLAHLGRAQVRKLTKCALGLQSAQVGRKPSVHLKAP